MVIFWADTAIEAAMRRATICIFSFLYLYVCSQKFVDSGHEIFGSPFIAQGQTVFLFRQRCQAHVVDFFYLLHDFRKRVSLKVIRFISFAVETG